MDSPILSTYMDMTKAARRVASAHNEVRDAIAQHASSEAVRRQEAHAQLTADNKLKEPIAQGG